MPKAKRPIASVLLAAVVLACLLAVDPWGWDRVGPLRWLLISTLGFAAVATGLLTRPVVAFWRTVSPVVSIGWALCLGGLTVSTIGSVLGFGADDGWQAVVGSPDRNAGLVLWILMAGLFSIAGSGPRPPVYDQRFVAWVAAAGAMLSGVWAVFEIGEIATLANGFGNRAGAAFGQPAYLGAAMVLAIPLASWLAISKREQPMARGVAFVSMLGGVAALIGSQTRAAWLGAVVAGALVAAINGRAGLARIPGSKKPVAWLGLAGVAVVGVALLVTPPVGPRLAAAADFEDGVVPGRIDEWQVGARALAGGDVGGLVGYGPEGYRIAFGAFVDEEYVVDHGREAFTDRAHNTYLDTALAGGWLAGAGLLTVHIGLLAAAIRAIRRPQAVLDVALAAAVAAYIVQQWFLFPLSEVDPFFWIVAGLLIGREVPPALPATGRSRLIGAAVAGAVTLAVACFGVLNVAADHSVNAALDSGDAEQVASRFPSTRYDFIASRIWSQPPSPAGYERALDRIEDGLALSPNDPPLLVEQAALLLERARRTNLPEHVEEALAALAERDLVDPNHPVTQQQYGIALALDGRYDEAITELEHAAELAPDSIEPLLNLAVVYDLADRPEDLEAVLDQAEALAPDDVRIAEFRVVSPVEDEN